MIIESPRLILRQFRDGDQQALFAMNSTSDVLRYIPGEPLKDVEEASQVLEKVIFADYRKYGYGRWAVEHKADGKVIGFCGPKFLPEFGKVELGYRYLPEYWGQGLGYEAASHALPKIKAICAVDELIALIMDGNLGSEAIALKLGMLPQEESELMGHKVRVFRCSL